MLVSPRRTCFSPAPCCPASVYMATCYLDCARLGQGSIHRRGFSAKGLKNLLLIPISSKNLSMCVDVVPLHPNSMQLHNLYPQICFEAIITDLKNKKTVITYSFINELEAEYENVTRLLLRLPKQKYKPKLRLAY